MKKYMNIETGSVGSRDDWWYEDDNGNQANSVDLGEVIHVRQSKTANEINEYGKWVEA